MKSVQIQRLVSSREKRGEFDRGVQRHSRAKMETEAGEMQSQRARSPWEPRSAKEAGEVKGPERV